MTSLNNTLDRTLPPALQYLPFVFRKPVELRFSNGIPLHILEAPGQEVVRIDFVFAAGQWHQAQKLQALFTCRMLREGCHGYSSSAFAERLDYYGAWLDLSVAMNRTFVTLYTLKKFFPQTIALVQHMLFEPMFDAAQLHTIKDNNKAQLMVNMQKGDVLALRALRCSIYGTDHPCGMLVSADDYDLLYPELLSDYYHRYYGSRNCTIYLSGDIDASVIAEVESLFGDAEWGSGSSPSEREYILAPSIEKHHTIVHPGAVQSSICMGTLLMEVNDADYLPMRVLNTVFGGYYGSRLMKNIREEKGYTYHISSDLVTNTSQTMFMVSCEALSDRDGEVVDEVSREMRRLQVEPISADELLMVRNYMVGEICRNYEGAFALTDAYIFMEHLGLPPDHIEQTVEAIRTTDACVLQYLAQRYFNPEKLHSVVVKS